VRPSITVLVPTFNEELALGRCLSSVAGWADELVVIDSGSTDATTTIARSFGAKVLSHRYENAPTQWRWIVEEAPVASQWLLALDADYSVTDELKREIDATLQSRPTAEGYYVGHRQIFRGRFLRHGGIYPRRRLCLFRRDAVRVEEFDWDIHFLVDRTGALRGDIIEENPKDDDLARWLSKQVSFASRAAEEEVAREGGIGYEEADLFGPRNQRIVWLKRLWSRLPLYWRSVAYFLGRYLFRLGFLDGKEGFLYHLTQGLVFRLLVDARIDELRNKKPG
jgi:glycosyltransferase involved in cell wall biosynthesis